VDQVEVEVIEPQPVQAGVAGCLGGFEALVGGAQLGGDEQLVAANARRGYRTTDGGLVSVRGGGVDQSAARLQCGQNRTFGLVVGQLGHTQAEDWHLRFVVERDRRD